MTGLLALALIAGLVPASAAASSTWAPRPVKAPDAGAQTDRVLVRWSTRLSAKAAAAAPRLATLASASGREADFVRFTGSGAAVYDLGAKLGDSAGRVLAALRALDGVTEVEPDIRMTAGALPNDPRAAELWGLLGAADGSPYGIDARGAWTTTTGAGVVVAVIDTGLVTHEDLVGQAVAGYDMVSDLAISADGDARDPDPSDPGDWSEAGDPCPPRASSWHGTHVAGTIAALVDNSLGVFGGAPGVKIQPVRVLGTCFGYASDIADGIRWAAGGSVPGAPVNATPARVLNLSLGGSSPVCPSEYSSAIADARSRGAVVVVSAGNSTADASQFAPANCAGVITVAAIDPAGKLADFSNYGPAVEIAGPGVSILSTVDSGPTVPVGSTYVYLPGTSMAAPHVALSAALVTAAYPSLTPDAIQTVLEGTVTAPAPDGSASGCPTLGCGSGIVNAARAFARLGAAAPIVGRVVPSTDAPDPNAAFTVSAGAVDLTGIASGQVSIDGGAWAPLSAADGSFGETDESLVASLTAPGTGGSHTVCVRATDPGANTSDGTACTRITVSAPPAGDDFASATLITGTSGSINGSNVGATNEVGEPQTSTIDLANGPYRTVWYSWTAPNGGTATFDLCASTYDTLMAVYAGSTFASLTRITDDDDTPGCGLLGRGSRVTFSATSAGAYRVQVDGFNADEGDFTLTWSIPDGTPPVVTTFGPTTPSPTSGTTISYSLTFDEPVFGLATNDFTIAGTSSGWTVASIGGTGGPGPYGVTLGATTPTPGTVELILHANAIADAGGIQGPAIQAHAASVTVTPDTTGPTGTVSINGGAAATTSTTVSVAVPASDASGVSHVRLANDSGMAGAVDRAYSTPQSWTLAAGADGSRTVYVQWRDTIGNWSAVSSDSVTLDTIAPARSAPAASLATGAALDKTTVPVRLAWSGSDTGSGLARFELAMSTNGGAWVDLALPSPTARTVSPLLTPGNASYRFRVRAIDAAGNASAWANGPIFRVRKVQESSTAIRYGGTWSRAVAAAALGGRYRMTTRARATATYVFTGRSIAWVANRGTAFGSARVYIDGVYRGTVNLRAPSTLWRQVVFSRTWSTPGRHTIRIVGSGTRGHPRVSVDAFVVLQ